MKLSKMRAKARSRFACGPGLGRIKYRWDDDGVIHDAPPPQGGFTEVTIVRGRAFTRPQAARQKLK